ncbi:ribonuclease Y [Sulfurihydrogenibium azorense]|uniref:ribonuclease Y n=1 Tax=Sulfurihydrogenibium azorense TaxID=309806 RepID=UPI00240A2386|nr:ribonuclease Y [Sulfurihydrogenibium azorense]MDM7273648.1 ribonuclease Y [Sulfurihydrogenibium azorense]
MNEVIVGLLSAVFAGGAGFTACKVMVEKKLKEKEEEYNKVLSRKEEIEKLAKEEAERIKKEAEKEVERILKEAEREAKIRASEIEKEALKLKEQQEFIIEKELLKRKQELENEIRQKREELQNLEKQLLMRESQLEKRLARLEHREEEIEKRAAEIAKLESEIKALEKQLKEKEEKLKSAEEHYILELQRIASMTKEEAKAELMRKVEEEAKLEAAKLMREIEEEAKKNAEKEAKWTLVTAIQRLAPEATTTYTVSVVDLPSNDIKGRIIGREGRNIRVFEMATGVDLIIDDTPDIVTISSFDPLRREIAKIALERLIADGRIHPGRIEEVVEKVKEEMDQHIRKLGEETCLELGFTDVHPELYYYIGKLNYRTSYTQNVLLHTKEVAYLAGMMAAMLGLDEKMARRGGLMHDIGKAISHEVGGAHSKVGAEIAKRYGEPDYVINAILYHHGDEPARYPEAVLVAAADALSAARPGARREVLQSYINRLEKIEAIVNSFENVEKSFAIQAGREVRVIVNAEKLSDEEAYLLTKEIAKRIEKEVEFPGQIKVVTIRESRFVEVAK